MAAPSPRTATLTVQGAGTSCVGTAPSGIAADDILILPWVLGNGGVSNIILPTGGWLELVRWAGPLTFGGVLITRRGSSNPSFTLAWTGSTYAEVGVIAVSGCDTGPLMFHDFAANGVSQKTVPKSPVVQSRVDECLAVAIGQNWNGPGAGGWTAPSGYTMTAIGADGIDLCAATKQIATASIENPAAFGNPGGGANDTFEATVLLMPPQSAVAVPGNFRGSRARRTRYGF